MSKNTLFQNSWKALEAGLAEPLLAGGVFAVKSSAGVGKTALLVQLAIGAMAKNEKVLHINVGEPIEKVDVWYKQLFKNIASGKNLIGAGEIWEVIAPNRFIMSFRVDGFNLPHLLERTNVLFVQGIFVPKIIILDGFNVAALKDLKSDFEKIKMLARANDVRIWLAINLEKKDSADDSNDHKENKDYDVVVKLQQDGERVSIIPQKGFSRYAHFYLDPVTMLLE